MERGNAGRCPNHVLNTAANSPTCDCCNFLVYSRRQSLYYRHEPGDTGMDRIQGAFCKRGEPQSTLRKQGMLHREAGRRNGLSFIKAHHFARGGEKTPRPNFARFSYHRYY